MKAMLMFGAALALTVGVTSCKKEVESNPVNPVTANCSTDDFHAKLLGDYKVFGSRDANTDWYYFEGGWDFSIGSDSIKCVDPSVFYGKYYIIDKTTVYIKEPNLEGKVSFSADTAVFSFDNGWQYKCVRQ